ncbi:SEL1-like repeat protein [Oscillospiraceae bacterium CM]|nr:SEL1-like repeat protein [Oscillospiraceae bacterium CM]
MPRLIFISPHFKSGAGNAAHLSYLVRYIATREGAAPTPTTDSNKPSTQKQAQLIRQIVKDFPLTKKRFEYQDYLANPTIANASDYIGIALEQNLDQIGKRENYVDYIGTRPGVSKTGAHGLFDGGGRELVLSQIQKEISEHPGVVWTPVISLRREDAQAMGYESPESWRAMLSACAADLAKAYKIKPEHLRWYASFHDQTHHPHVHMILYSTDPKEGFLTKDGITQVKSALARSIFPEQLQELYAADTRQRDALKENARRLYQELIDRMASGVLKNDRIEKLTEQLVAKLAMHKGKMQYGYLQAPVKAIVDEIVDELARGADVTEAFRLWFDIRTDILSTYQDEVQEIPPLSKQKEFKPVRNMVVVEAAKLVGHEFSFEEDANDEPEAEANVWALIRTVKADDADETERRNAVMLLLRKADGGNSDAAYAVGKLLMDEGIMQKDAPKALDYFRTAADAGNSYAMYQLGKRSITGEDAPKNASDALCWFASAAEQGNAAAQYALGKLYLSGADVPKDMKAALLWFTRAAEQGNQYAQFFVDHWNEVRSPSSFIAATRVLHHMSRIFQDNTPPRRGGRIQLDKKLLRELKQKKIAQGHKADDHEQEQTYITY